MPAEAARLYQGTKAMNGNGKNLRYLSEAYHKGKLSHAYILEGSRFSGKEAFADRLAAALLCENNSSSPLLEPCGRCPSCIRAFSGNHPDLIHVRHEKDTVLSVGEIREQIVQDIAIKPYYGPWKIYIVPDAQLMNESAQNALLKTIEEPAPYGILLLLTENADEFLPTIRSRCIRLGMEAVPKAETVKALLDENGQRLLNILKEVPGMDARQISQAAKDMETMNRQNTLDLLQLWFRDLLVYKSTGQNGGLYFVQEQETIGRQADRLTLEAIGRMIDAQKEAAGRLNASVKAEAAWECLLLSVRRQLWTKKER